MLNIDSNAAPLIVIDWTVFKVGLFYPIPLLKFSNCSSISEKKTVTSL